MSGSISDDDGFKGLELRQLSRRVDNHTLVDQLSLTVAAGEILAVLGSAPLILLMLLFQRQIISGLTQGAIKG